MYFPSIKALAIGFEANTYTRVRVFYKWINYSVIYYETRSYAAAIPTAALALTPSTINASVSGSNYVGGTRTHTFSFSLVGTLAIGDFLMFDYPANYFDSQGIYAAVSATGFTVLVVYQTNQIYLQATSAMSGAITVNIANLNNPSYSQNAAIVVAFQ